MKKVRILNGYRLIYLPEHNKAMSNKNWLGYVYEHVVVAEKMIGRSIKENEVVHHLDLNRSNNRIENLIVLEKGQHTKLHAWIDGGAVTINKTGEKKTLKIRYEPKSCIICERILQHKQAKYCSLECKKLGYNLTSKKPNKEELEKLLVKNVPFIHIGEKYGVSGNAVKNG